MQRKLLSVTGAIYGQRNAHVEAPYSSSLHRLGGGDRGHFRQQPESAPSQSGTINTVAVIADTALGEPAQHGLRKLEAVLRTKAIEVSEGEAEVNKSDLVLLFGLANRRGAAAAALEEMKTPAPTGAEALTVRINARYHQNPAIVVTGFDDTGLMYAALDLADRVGRTGSGENPFRFAQDVDEQPYLKERGVVMFTMNRAYFESRLFDEQFWVRYFDMLSKDRFNRLVLIFGYEDGGYMAPLYPYFFEVDGFPDVRVVGLTREQQSRNVKSLKAMLRLAAEHGIVVKPGVWEHICRAGIQAGANRWASDGTKPTPGLVWGLTAKNLVPYTVAALKKVYDVFPEFTETQFRMHEESGLLKSEIEPFWHDVFAFFRNSKPDVRLEFRAKGLHARTHRTSFKTVSEPHDAKHWKDEMKALDAEFEKLLAERQSAIVRSDAKAMAGSIRIWKWKLRIPSPA